MPLANNVGRRQKGFVLLWASNVDLYTSRGLPPAFLPNHVEWGPNLPGTRFIENACVVYEPLVYILMAGLGIAELSFVSSRRL
jgi:hypothetical protein